MTNDTPWMNALIADNADMLGRRYYWDISYIPTITDQFVMPVKYGMSDLDRNEAESHNPSWSDSDVRNGKDVRFSTIDDGTYYFAGKDGFVWTVMKRDDMPDRSELDDATDLSEYDWYTAVCVAASDMHHSGKNVPHEAINYGWYLARKLSHLVWTNQTNENIQTKLDSTDNTDK